MNKLATAALAAAVALTLAACGRSDSAKDGAQADNVEMPAEEAVGDIDATPVADATAAGAESAALTPAASETPANAKPSGQ